MVQFPIDPRLDEPLDIGKINDHMPVIKRVGLDVDFHQGVVPVEMPAHAVIVEQAVAVTKIEALGDEVRHQLLIMHRCGVRSK